MPQFVHEPLEFQDLPTTYVKGYRHYETPSGVPYPSVTTVTGYAKRDVINEWKKKVGEEKAQQVMTKASRRGTIFHEVVEQYLKNDPDWKRSVPTPADLVAFNCIKPLLDQHVGTVFALEEVLYSDYLRIAGRVDCIAEYNGKLSIIDFKTSSKRKKKEWIDNYFMQGCAYATALFELHKLRAEQIVILMEIQDEGSHEVFIENPADWIEPLKDLRVQYAQEFGV